MSCQVEQIADCGAISSIGRALYLTEREDPNWLTQCSVSLSSCGNLLAVAYKSRLCLLTSQWISSTDSNSYLISWSGSLPGDVTALLTLAICPTQHSSQNFPDWFCIVVGFNTGYVSFYTNTGHLLISEKLEDKPVMKISCHTGTYGLLPDDIEILYQSCECIITGSSLFQLLRDAKSQIAKVEAGVQEEFIIDIRSIQIKKLSFTNPESVTDAIVVGLELKNTYDHLLAASTYGGYDTWYRSVPPISTLILTAGVKPYIGFHYALEGGTTPPLQDVARVVANKIKSALPGWLGVGGSGGSGGAAEPKARVRAEALSMRYSIGDHKRHGTRVAISPDRRLAALADNLARVAVLDLTKGHIIRIFKGHRDAQVAFVQIFEQDGRKLHLTYIKEFKRAIFLIIYNPRKGLIDIRLMQRGERVALFTATKNGKLLYSTCGMVGAEKSYTNSKLNLPGFQCVFMDPDGKIKKFNIPFFYALEGENSTRSKDLHILRELKEFIKKQTDFSSECNDELINKTSLLKTLDLKKHCLDLLVKKYEIPLKTVVSCLKIFWDSIADKQTNDEVEKVKCYFKNILLLILFYRNINNEMNDDMKEMLSQIQDASDKSDLNVENNEPSLKFHLLQDDNCILERLLILAHENNYKDHQHPKVTFAEDNTTTFKEYASCFNLYEKSKHIPLKSELSSEKKINLAASMFKSIFKMADVRMLSNFTRDSRIDPKDIINLLILHMMNIKMEEITIELIEKLIAVMYYVCRVSEEATHVVYNEFSPWWETVRANLVEMPCPLRTMVVAMACKAVVSLFETKGDDDDDAWVSLTDESAKWGIFIGKLEDISLLSIVLLYKETFKGNPLPQLQFNDVNINLKYMYTRGRGCVSEVVAKWACSVGVAPRVLLAYQLAEEVSSRRPLDDPDMDSDDEDTHACLIYETHRDQVEQNPNIFKWFSLLRRQFPYSTSSDYVLANMCWEYAMSWHKNMKKSDHIIAAVECMNNISDLHLRLGLFTLVWSTYINNIFESSCRLVNKVGRLPKEPLSLQAVGLDSADLIGFLGATTKYFEAFVDCYEKASGREKQKIKFEKIWDGNIPSLVEVAQDAKTVNSDILILNYQISCTIYYQCHFNYKFSKPLDTLYDIDYHYIFEALTGNVTTREISMIPSEKIRNPRMKFVTKVIREAVNTLSRTSEPGDFNETYDFQEYNAWIQNATTLAELWRIDKDFVRRQQTVALYHTGYDDLAASEVESLKEPEIILRPLVAISIQRMKRSLEHSSNVPEWIATMPPHLYRRLKTTELDTSIPAHPSLSTTIKVLQKMIYRIDKQSDGSPTNVQDFKLAKLIMDSCEVLVRRKL